MNELLEIKNIYPTNIERVILRSNQKSKKTTMKVVADTICRGQISEKYINWAFNNFTRGFIYYKDDNPFAFCIWQETTTLYKDSSINAEIKILLLCAEKSEFKVADYIFNDLTGYCSRHGFTDILLEPINDAIREYYKSYGFVDESGKKLMRKEIEILPIRYTRKTLKKKRNILSNSSMNK
jgi:hypothetical protein